MKRLFLLLSLSLFLIGPVPAQTNKTRSKAKTTATTKKKTTTSRKATSSTTRKKTVAKTSSRRRTPVKKEGTSIESLRSRQKQLQAQLKKNEGQLYSTNRNVKRQLGDLAVLNGKIDKQKRSISDIQLQVDSLSRNITTLKKHHEELSGQLKDRIQKYNRSMLYLYKNKAHDNKLLFILSAENFSQMLRRYRYVREYSKYQQIQGQLIKKKKEQVAEVKQSLENTKSSKNQMLNVQKGENVKLTKQQDEQQATVKGLQKKQVEIQRVIAQNKKEMAQLNAKIDYYVRLAIERERKRREAEARARAEAAEKARLAEEQRRQAALAKANGTNSSSKKTSAKEAPAEKAAPKAAPMATYKMSKEYALDNNFSSNRGRLPMPITGRYVISAHYGSYNMEGLKGVQLNNKGINITGQSGAQARCIFSGEVSYIFSLGGLYNVLVRHGSYISVYCNLSSVSVGTGQKVSTRQTLGSIARDASGRCTLHFQLRKETATLNPESWLAR